MSETRPGCTVCRHPDVDAIDAAIRANIMPYREIGQDCGLSDVALEKHARQCLRHYRHGEAEGQATSRVLAPFPPCPGYGVPGQSYCPACSHKPDCGTLGKCKKCLDVAECICWNPEEMPARDYRRMEWWKAQAVKCGRPAPTVLRPLSDMSERLVCEREEVVV